LPVLILSLNCIPQGVAHWGMRRERDAYSVNLDSMMLKENQPLASLTTLGVGGLARWFVEAATEAEIEEAVRWAADGGVELFVLGGGSNLVVADAGVDGLVLKIGLRGLHFLENGGGDGRVLRAGAGVEWEHCVQQSTEADLAGIECLAGIPGTVGGTPVQNVGAYGQEVSTVIDRVRAFDRHERAFVELSASECNFSYRRSRFNTTDRNRFIVTRVDYRLTPGGAPTIRYAELERAIAASHPDGAEATLAEVAGAVRRIRQSKGMLLVDGDPDCRSAGSFFKNPVISEELYQKVALCNPAPPRFPADPGNENDNRVKIPAAWLIEHAGFAKGYAPGAAGISSKHTLALINRGGATAADILTLAQRISDAVAEKFGIRLEMEPERVGF
jgi:UDP-N-acetylmuramate dehydrogenase